MLLALTRGMDAIVGVSIDVAEWVWEQGGGQTASGTMHLGNSGSGVPMAWYSGADHSWIHALALGLHTTTSGKQVRFHGVEYGAG